jgi:hypothetical protein
MEDEKPQVPNPNKAILRRLSLVEILALTDKTTRSLEDLQDR